MLQSGKFIRQNSCKMVSSDFIMAEFMVTFQMQQMMELYIGTPHAMLTISHTPGRHNIDPTFV